MESDRDLICKVLLRMGMQCLPLKIQRSSAVKVLENGLIDNVLWMNMTQTYDQVPKTVQKQRI
jgi:hypothetical protein